MPTYRTDEEFLRSLEYDRVYSRHVGKVPIVFGRTANVEAGDPVIFAAAFSERDLRNERCGFGTSEAEASADLFRASRPESGLLGMLR